MKDALQYFVHCENIAHYRKLIADSERDQWRDEDRHKIILRLLTDKLAKDDEPPKGQPTGTSSSLIIRAIDLDQCDRIAFRIAHKGNENTRKDRGVPP